MSASMAPVACIAAPRAPHGSQHGPNSCKFDTSSPAWTTRCRSAWMECMRRDTPLSACRSACFGCRYRDTSCFNMSCCMFLLHARRHLELLLTLSWLDSCHHVLIPSDQATSSFSVPLRDFDPSCEFLTRDQSRIFFRSHSDSLNIFNKLQMMSDIL